MKLFCCNQDAHDIAHNSVQHDRTKHVEADRFFIKEKLEDKIVEVLVIRIAIQNLFHLLIDPAVSPGISVPNCFVTHSCWTGTPTVIRIGSMIAIVGVVLVLTLEKA
ncbi:hypothetical protein L3X38_042037 [Prunus dulcis]|uniref:Copia protein n=1 Tax=Prunus dulcis TaxID=3755 RepID=A0AAD4YLL2_PRUDU|nr:hypothetical protein L3X38_042037 [Prunus dulcis]